MPVDERGFVISFLHKIIDDNQATIRFLDTKAGFGIAILGAMVGKVLLDQDQLNACTSHGLLGKLVAIAFGILVLLTATLGYRIVFPLVNPAKNVSLPDNLSPEFFIHEFANDSFLKWFSSNKKFATLATTHNTYCDALRNVAQEQIESVLAAEVLKLSFIRQLKTDRLSAFAKFLILTVLAFIGLIFVAPKQTAARQDTSASCATGPMPATCFHIYNAEPPAARLQKSRKSPR
jgi:hypothetical protein